MTEPLSYRNQSIDLLRIDLIMASVMKVLKGQLEGPAADYIQGFSSSSKNYEEVKKLLEERFGNHQVVISAHMNVSLKVPKLNNDSVSRLSSFYNTIESHIRSLLTTGLNPSHYGPLLI